jgi:hypothetical protein
MPEDDDTCLVISGDLWTSSKYLRMLDSNGLSWMHKTSLQFKHVVFVLGNHDYWNTKMDKEPDRVRKLIAKQGLTNVHLLENSSVDVDQIRFVGGTLWTDYGDNSAISKMAAINYMNDYEMTRIGSNTHKPTPDDILPIFHKTKKTIFDTKSDGKLLAVVTHMAPSYNSVNEHYRNKNHELQNTWYYSNMDNSIANSDIALWFHGHMHNRSNYMIGNTRVLCNPKGYALREDTGYDPYARLMID